jgi:hypothetical protein
MEFLTGKVPASRRILVNCRSLRKYTMRNPTGMQIVRRAYQLWEQAGKPEGRDEEFYHEAERQLKNEEEPTESAKKET